MPAGFTVGGIGNFLNRDFIYINNGGNWKVQYLIEEVKNAFLIGLIIYPLFIGINSYRLKSKYVKKGAKLSQHIQANTAGNQELIQFENANGNIDLELNFEAFLFVKSEGNYVQVFYRQDGIKKKMIRNTMTAVAKKHPDFFRPHRSYIVNQFLLSKIGGNSQGYTLHFKDVDQVIPESRSKKGELQVIQQKLS